MNTIQTDPGHLKQTLQLSDLRPGQSARITGIHANQGGSLVRLMEIGLIPGQTVQMIKFAPLGDPIELRVMNYNLVVRKKEASAILVELL
tara:strand:+ start:161 stop:430 length:270 start_codon:yes stop_codon:yes gene_type:complete